MNWVTRFKSLPKKTKRLLTLGIVLALVAGLPLFIWAMVSQKFLINQRASETTILLNFQETFTGNGPMDASKWNWSGYSDNAAYLESDQLKVTLPEGPIDVGDYYTGKTTVVNPLVDYQIPQITGEFDVSVDVNSIEASGSGIRAGLKFAPTSGIMLTRTKSSSGESIDLWSSLTNTVYNNIATFSLPDGTGVVKLRLSRTDHGIDAYYDIGNGYVLLLSITDQNYAYAVSSLPRIMLDNMSPGYPSAIAYFDNYQVYAHQVVPGASPTPQPTSTPTATATATPTPSAVPACTLDARICPDGSLVGRVPPNCDFAPCPASTATASPTATPTGTPPPTQRPIVIRFKFLGVSGNQASSEALNGGYARVMIKFSSPSLPYEPGYITEPQPAMYEGNGVYRLSYGLWSADFPAYQNYSISLKGEKHVMVKFCENSGQTVHCPGQGHISFPEIPLTTVNLDFTGIPLPPGDIPPQDGSVSIIGSGSDLYRLLLLLAKPPANLTEWDLYMGDLDYNQIIDIRDLYLLKQALTVRYDD